MSAFAATCSTHAAAKSRVARALSDSLGRRPMMLALAALTLVLRLAVVAAPCAAAVIASRVVVSSLVNGFLVLVAASVADLGAPRALRRAQFRRAIL